MAGQEAAVVQAAPAAPPAKRARGLGAMRREQLRRATLSSEALVPAEPDDPIAERAPVEFRGALDVSGAADVVGGDADHISRAAAGMRGERLDIPGDRIDDGKATMSSSDAAPLGNDLSLKTGLKLSTAYFSFRWLRRLPPALLCQARQGSGGVEVSASIKDSVLDVCKEYFPALAEVPDRAVRWMEKIAACLCWYQLDGPLSAHAAPKVDSFVTRSISEWDEAYRGLEVLLRQGSIPTFSIVSDKFTVSVYGDGGGAWESARGGAAEPMQQQPSKDAPCAVVCPSFADLRAMLQESHVPFEVALARLDPSAAGGSPKVASAAADGALVPAALAKEAAEDDICRGELRELRRDRERVVAPELQHGTVPLSEALWFQGAWRVHALLDVLRQHFLGAPLPVAPAVPSRLPRLLSPAPFSHAAAKSARVVKTQTVSAEGGRPLHIVELEGVFFPKQVRGLLETLRVLLTKFSCDLTVPPEDQKGINVFTSMGMRRVEHVEVERVQATAPNQKPEFKWEFKLIT